MAEGAEKQRVDKWLWQARFFKTRGRSGEIAASGKLRVNGAHVAKSSHAVRPGDVLTFPQGRTIRVIRVEAIGARRGPAAEAAGLFTDLEPPAPREPETKDPGRRETGSGRPTKRDRRQIDRLTGLERGEA